MTLSRLIPLPVHGALELLTGMFTMAVPFLLGFGPAAAIVSILAGVLLVGLALQASSAEPGRGAIDVTTHHAADSALALGLFGAAAIFAFDGDGVAAATLLAIAGVQLMLNLNTRYTLRG